ncbi:DUF7619 domain-containing protein [Adhaeribacter soli]|nr:T9SS type A sorting domain-containing protein [Adhaeribacter soli]
MKKLLLLCLLSALTSFKTSAQFFQWAKSQENTIDGTNLAAGNNLLATTGSFFRTITLGNQVLSSPDSNNHYLAVSDHAGNVLWAKHIKSYSFNKPSVTVDANQNILIAGTFRSSLDIDGLLFQGSSPNKHGVFVAKFKPTGTLLWARSSDVTTGNLSSNHLSASVAADGAGNVYVGGDFNNSLTFNGTSITALSGNNAFLVKYDAAGTLLWANTVGSSTWQDRNVKINVTPTGYVYLSNIFGIVTQPFFGFSVTKINPAGTVLWNKLTNGSIFDINLTVDELENTYISGYLTGNITIGNTTITANPNNFFLAKLNSSGNWKWAKSISANFPPPTGAPPTFLDFPKTYYTPKKELAVATAGAVTKLDTAGTVLWTNSATGNIYSSGLSGDQFGNLFVSGQFHSGNAQFSATTLSTSAFSAGFLAKVTREANTISGTVFRDMNSNGILDASESPFSQVMVATTPGPIYGLSSSDGTYNIYLPSGSSAVALPNPPRYYTAVPANHIVTFSGMNQVLANKDFALQPIPNSNDVKVAVTNLAPARPGFTFKYLLTYQNVGTTTLSDTLSFTYNTTNLIFGSSTTVPVSHNNGKLTWYYQNLQPDETRSIELTFSVPVSTVLGTSIQAAASIKPFTIDLNKEDNNAIHHLTVVGSYDPNDKQVDKPTLTLLEAANGNMLDYTIRFQNTGTDTAFTVIVTDKVPANLNLVNFEMVAASHAYKLSLEDNQLVWRFDNILLPDSNRNEPASHGFARFRIKTKPGLALGDSVANKAAIYFDYNAPVITNYAITRVANPTGVKEAKAGLQPFSLHPNPAKNYVMVASAFKKQTVSTVSLVNLLGQILHQVTLPANEQIHYQMPLNNLPKGVYVVQLETENGRQTQRLVIR